MSALRSSRGDEAGGHQWRKIVVPLPLLPLEALLDSAQQLKQARVPAPASVADSSVLHRDGSEKSKSSEVPRAGRLSRVGGRGWGEGAGEDGRRGRASVGGRRAGRVSVLC